MIALGFLILTCSINVSKNASNVCDVFSIDEPELKSTSTSTHVNRVQQVSSLVPQPCYRFPVVHRVDFDADAVAAPRSGGNLG